MTPDRERQAFLAALAENEEDDVTRLVYADWLEEHGEDDEAARQRAIPPARAWMDEFCAANSPEYEDHVLTDRQTLVTRMCDAVDKAEAMGGDIEAYFGSNMDLMHAVREQDDEFWRNWSVLTGRPVPEDYSERSSFRCGC